MKKRPSVHLILLVICAAVVGWSSLQTPRIGRCGSALYLLYRIYAARVLLALNIPSIQMQAIGVGIATLISVLVFLAPAVVWLKTGPRSLRMAGILGWTVCYLVLYFFSFPTVDCP